MAYISVLSKTVTLPVAGVLEVEGIGLQGFPAGAAQWGFQLYIDGLMVWAPQGISAEVTVALGGMKQCAAGDRLVELRWAAATTVKLHSAFLKIKAFNNTAGV